MRTPIVGEGQKYRMDCEKKFMLQLYNVLAAREINLHKKSMLVKQDTFLCFERSCVMDNAASDPLSEITRLTA